MKRVSLFAGCMCVAALPLAAERIVYDFESGDLQGWKVTRGAFARPVTDLAREHNTGLPYTKGGTYFVSTLENRDNRPNDGQTGEIESPTVRLTSSTITFKIGGGAKARLELVDRATGKALAAATGENGEKMRTVIWNVPEAVGKNVFFRVVDDATGSWAHVTVDDIACDGMRGKADFDERPRAPRKPPLAFHGDGGSCVVTADVSECADYASLVRLIDEARAVLE